MTTSPFSPLLRTQADVEGMWRTLMRPLGWRRRACWFALVGADDRPLPHLGEIDEMAAVVHAEEAAAPASVWRDLVDEYSPGGRVALLLCRPGLGVPTAEDRATAAALYAACRDLGLASEVIHLATDDDIWPLSADEVLGRSA